MYLIDASAVASAHAQKVHEEFPVSRSATMDGSGGAMLVAAQLRMQGMRRARVSRLKRLYDSLFFSLLQSDLHARNWKNGLVF
jgi:hypothetical protein